MADALIGHSGFVGTTLLRQRSFDHLFRSTDIADIRGQEFDTVVCAGAPAQKWIANREPQTDRARIQSLIDELSTIRCRQLILISTVDVFGHPQGVTEGSRVDLEGLHAYGANRHMLEQFAVSANFERHLIVRLPGLVGPGLRKNVIFDLLNDNNLAKVDSRASFQFYPMVNLWFDIELALKAGLNLVHLTAESMTVGEIAREGFGINFTNHTQNEPVMYNMESLYAEKLGGNGRYHYSKRESLMAVRAYAQSEPRRELGASS